jgi:hypothetical protein
MLTARENGIPAFTFALDQWPTSPIPAVGDESLAVLKLYFESAVHTPRVRSIRDALELRPTSARAGRRSISGSRARIRRCVLSAVAATCAGSGNCPPWHGGRRHAPPGSPLRASPSLKDRSRCVVSADVRYNRANESAAVGHDRRNSGFRRRQ